MSIMTSNTDKMLFVTGTDTDAGKTFATGWYARRLMDRGLKVVTMKFIQTGCTDSSDDLLLHRRLMGIDLLPEDREMLTAPEIYTYPASPHLSARIDNRPVDLDKIWNAACRLADRYDIVLIEGAGGPLVPIDDNGTLTLDFPKTHGIPSLLVTNARLGSISHTLLTLEALTARGINVKTVLFNHHYDTDPLIAPDTHDYLKRFIERNYPGTEFIDVPSITL